MGAARQHDSESAEFCEQVVAFVEGIHGRIRWLP